MELYLGHTAKYWLELDEKADKIIGQSLKGNEEYLNYLWINNIEKSNSEKIYIPTEAGMPILEARSK